MHRSLRFAAVLIALAFLPFAAARAQLTIEIVGGAGTAVPIAVVPFGGEVAFPLGISGIVAADLGRSGMFKLIGADNIIPRPSRARRRSRPTPGGPAARTRWWWARCSRCRMAGWRCASRWWTW